MKKQTVMLLGLALVGSSCGGGSPEEPIVKSFTVALEGAELLDERGVWVARELSSLSDDPLPFGARTRFTLAIDAVDGELFDGYVQIRAVPGIVEHIDSDDSEVVRTSVIVRGGATTHVVAEITGAYGETRLWAEDVGFVFGAPRSAACDDGEDNDGDGLYDYPTDPGCFLRNDDSEAEGTHAVGVTSIIPFVNPRLSDAQGCGPVSSLERQVVTVDQGLLYITAVTTNGFYVSDFGFMEGGCDPATGCCEGGRWAHVYAYNFNTPYGLRVCDRLASVGGIIGDFYGFTELNFPSWTMYDIDQDPDNGLTLMRTPPLDLGPEDCPITAHVLTDQDILDMSIMESWEAGLVEIHDAVIPHIDDWVDCDLNGDGEVAYRADQDICVPRDEVQLAEPYCTTEGECCELQCNNVCDAGLCAELSSYRLRGDIPVQVGTAKISVNVTLNLPGYDAREAARNGDRTITRLSAMLDEFAPLDDPWGMGPRCRQDIHIEGNDDFPDVPIYQRCVPSEETGDYEDPY